MDKRKISKYQQSFLNDELDFYCSEDLIDSESKEHILSLYELQKISIVKILLTIGALLLGLGVLSFIASNWSAIGKPMKVFTIILGILGANVTGYKMMNSSPKTSRSFFYVGAIIYGAGIFLVGQIFNNSPEWYNYFLMWGLGILPMALLLEDVIIFSFLNFALFIYANGYYFSGNDRYPYLMILVIPTMYSVIKKLNTKKLPLFIANTISLNLISLAVFKCFGDVEVVQLTIFFIIGLSMIFIPTKNQYKEVFKLQGAIVHGIAGLMLTMPGSYYSYDMNSYLSSSSLYLVFTVIYLIILFFLINKGSLSAIIILCAVIFRFYLDISFDFMPKSIVFILGGLILMGFGYLFEKKRRGDLKNEEE